MFFPMTESTPTEFHNAVTQMVLQQIGFASGVGHLATLAKAQVVCARTVRRLIKRGQLCQRDPSEFTPDEVTELVLEEDKADEAEGTGQWGSP